MIIFKLISDDIVSGNVTFKFETAQPNKTQLECGRIREAGPALIWDTYLCLKQEPDDTNDSTISCDCDIPMVVNGGRWEAVYTYAAGRTKYGVLQPIPEGKAVFLFVGLFLGLSSTVLLFTVIVLRFSDKIEPMFTKHMVTIISICFLIINVLFWILKVLRQNEVGDGNVGTSKVYYHVCGPLLHGLFIVVPLLIFFILLKTFVERFSVMFRSTLTGEQLKCIYIYLFFWRVLIKLFKKTVRYTKLVKLGGTASWRDK